MERAGCHLSWPNIIVRRSAANTFVFPRERVWFGLGLHCCLTINRWRPTYVAGQGSPGVPEAGVAVARHPFLVVGAEHRADGVVHADYFTRLQHFLRLKLQMVRSNEMRQSVADRVFIGLSDLCDKVRSDSAD